MSHDHRKEQVTLPPLSFKNRNTAFVKFLSSMTRNAEGENDKPGRNPATTAKVKDLQNGKVYLLLCPTLLISSLESYGENYVNCSYEIHVSSEKVEGKEYKAVDVYKIDPDADYSKFDIVDKPADGAEKET